MSTRGPDPKVADSELLDAVKRETRPFATAKSVSQTVSLSRERARQRLNRLSDQGKIEREKVAGGIVIYWLSDSQ